MGTVINGTKVNNFYINGSKVNGFAKNGEIVFKREGDAVAPVYNSLGIVRNNNAGETRDTHYAKIGDSVRVLIYFSEQLAVEPKVKIANKEFVATYRPLSSSNGLFAYYADCDLTEDLHLAVGEIQIEVYGYADSSGNVGVKLTNADINNSAHEYVIFDDIPPEYVQIQVYNKNNTSSTTITNGETVRILATFNTELGTLPTLSIGKQKILMKATSDGKGGIIYQADITIASDNIMEEGVLKFTISGYTDKNGNEGEKVTEANARNSLTYYV